MIQKFKEISISQDNQDSNYFKLENALFDLEAELRDLSLWSEEAPSAEALNSSMPFCVDSLDFHQWLQFIFIPRCYELINEQASLSINAAILPMAEESYKEAGNREKLFAILKSLDDILR